MPIFDIGVLGDMDLAVKYYEKLLIFEEIWHMAKFTHDNAVIFLKIIPILI